LWGRPSARTRNELFADQKRGGDQRREELEPFTDALNDFRNGILKHFLQHLLTLCATEDHSNYTARYNQSTDNSTQIKQSNLHLFNHSGNIMLKLMDRVQVIKQE
jgi:hypothetical protein